MTKYGYPKSKSARRGAIKLNDYSFTPKKKKKVKPVSEKRKGENDKYSNIRKEFLVANPTCECCGEPSTEVHHKNKRNGQRLNDIQFFMAICRGCHDEIHRNPKYANENGWLL